MLFCCVGVPFCASTSLKHASVQWIARYDIAHCRNVVTNIILFCFVCFYGPSKFLCFALIICFVFGNFFGERSRCAFLWGSHVVQFCVACFDVYFDEATLLGNYLMVIVFPSLLLLLILLICARWTAL